MRLLIISGMPHHLRNGRIVGWGATVHEIDHLAQLFDEIRHIAILHAGPAPASALPYESERVTVIPMPPAGGGRIADKLRILVRYPKYALAILRELRNADVVHVRCPDNISLLAIVLLALVRTPKSRWVKYAGNWDPRSREPWSYTFQRWWLKRGWSRSRVTVNGRWPGQPEFVRSFNNPCLTAADLEEGRGAAARKSLTAPIRLIYVGRIETAKGVGQALRIMARLREQSCSAVLELVGDGPERHQFERQAQSLGIAERTIFHGWLPRTALAPLYARSHVALLPTAASEGWPKILSEAMAYGAVPVAGDVSCIPQFLESFGCGRALPADDIESYVELILGYARFPATWQKESELAVKSAGLFSYDHYLDAVSDLLGIPGPHTGRA